MVFPFFKQSTSEKSEFELLQKFDPSARTSSPASAVELQWSSLTPMGASSFIADMFGFQQLPDSILIQSPFVFVSVIEHQGMVF